MYICNYYKGQGLFCFLKVVLRSVIQEHIVKKKKIKINISNTFYPYKNNHNEIKNNLFEIIETNDKDLRNLLLNIYNNKINEKIKNIEYWSNTLSFKIKNKVFCKYFKLNKLIYQKVDNILKDINSEFIIGVHFRSHVSKISELRNTIKDYKIKYINDYINSIKKYILDNNLKKYKIYLVTDILTNIKIFKDEFNDKLYFNKNNIWLSKNKMDVEPHFGFTVCNKSKNNKNFLNLFNRRKPGLKGAIELFVDTIVLSKCNIFFKSDSNLSFFVRIINPSVQIVNV